MKRKPRPWSFNPSSVPRCWRSLWDDALMVTPIWTPGKPINLMSREFATVESSVLSEQTALGPCKRFQGYNYHTTSSVYWSALGSKWTGLSKATVWAVFSRGATAQTQFGRIVGVMHNGDDDFGFYMDNTGDIWFRADDGSAQDVVCDTNYAAGAFHIFHGVFNGASLIGYSDGQYSNITNSVTYNFAGASDTRPWIGECPDNTFNGSQFSGRILAGGVHGSAWTPTRIRRHALNWFGLLYPERRVVIPRTRVPAMITISPPRPRRKP